jgi:hypothetical protein
VLQTTAATNTLLIDGVESGTVVIDGLAFDFDTPTPDADGVTTYAIRAQNAYERVEIRNSVFDIGPAARGAIHLSTPTVPTATGLIDAVVITGGAFGVSIQDVDVMVTGNDISGNSLFGISISGAASGAEVVVQGNTFADCGTRCVRPISGSDVDVIANDFGQCGSQRCISVGSGAHVDVMQNTFAAPVLTGDSGPDQNNIVLLTQSSTGVIDDNVFDGCGFWDCIDIDAGATATISNNEFTHVAGQTEWDFSDIIQVRKGANATVELNTLHSCGVICYKILDGSTATIRNETVTTPAGHGTQWILLAAEDAPASGPNTVVFEDNVVTGAGAEVAASLSAEAVGTLAGNTFTALASGIELHGGASLTGRDNIFGLSGTAISIFDGFADFRFNDLTGQATDIGSAGDGTSILTCNWWDDAAGPQEVAGAPSSMFTPWALAPIAGTGASDCAGGLQ